MLAYDVSGSDILAFLTLFGGSLLVSLLLTSFLIKWLTHRLIVAEPNARSMHSQPTPVGGGWVILFLTLLAWVSLSPQPSNLITWGLPAGALVLAFVSWFDDMGFVHPLLRLGTQAVIVTTLLFWLPGDKVVFFEEWPLWLDRLVTGLCWMWFINLFNFMDGIDGLVGSGIVSICAGIILTGLSIGFQLPMLQVLMVLAGASVGFLWWNWSPARLFLGDVGAISIGFFLGGILIQLAMEGYLAAAFLLPGYFVVDASLTLLKRIRRGEPFWQAHRTHYYQRATQAMGAHSFVVWRIVMTNIVLIVLAVISLRFALAASVAGICVIASLLIYLERKSVK